jgi:hypothetical protein
LEYLPARQKGADKADQPWQYIEYLTTDQAIDIIFKSVGAMDRLAYNRRANPRCSMRRLSGPVARRG